MSNKSVSTRFFETYGQRHDVEGCRPLFADNAVINTSTAPLPLNFDAYREVGQAFLNGFADLYVEILEQFEAGDKVATRVAWSGTHTGPLNTPAGAIPPTGKTIRLKFAEAFEMRDGKIKTMRAYWDTGTLMRQLGLI